jgi:hypothetical protein
MPFASYALTLDLLEGELVGLDYSISPRRLAGLEIIAG